jgi:hypothetical protein
LPFCLTIRASIRFRSFEVRLGITGYRLHHRYHSDPKAIVSYGNGGSGGRSACKSGWNQPQRTFRAGFRIDAAQGRT